MNTLGICLGASTIKAVVAQKKFDNIQIIHSVIRSHGSDPKKIFSGLIEELQVFSPEKIVVTGRHFKNLINASSITEPQAIECALEYTGLPFKNNLPNALISLGAENFILYLLDKKGYVTNLETGGKCASGTGEFFYQQVRRMGLSVEDAVKLAEKSEPYKVSGRCSVFCKSDCTHALNKGTPVERVSAGLCRMIADKISDLLEKATGHNILAAGGVTSNHVIMNMVKEKYPEIIIPQNADLFEAVGAAINAFTNGSDLESKKSLFTSGVVSSFQSHPPLSSAVDKVSFKIIGETSAKDGDELIIGLDVGSTTTKAVAFRVRDCAIAGKVYLRTNGNPVQASRNCYESLSKQITAKVRYIGIGTTGSGRQISGLHSGTPAVINEIIAHSTAASFFDPSVDTIFEIGGQDAKYTFLTNGVPSDYAMNEACSAGTGSFLEEAALESLGIDYLDIQNLALKSKNPPDFNDQCAAFISSDIKTASHEGIAPEDITAGLVYSICMNYVNRVKGRRPAGKKIFMQGGVCYNKAVPLAMANLLDREIVVPPEPGLMGAFGVALEVKHKIENGLLEKNTFDPEMLASREITSGKSFICAGGAERCDRKCEINMMIIEGKSYPFGGACNRYYNLLRKAGKNNAGHDYTSFRQHLLFDKPVIVNKKRHMTVGLNRSFLTHMLYPLYSTFFREIGLEPVLSDSVSVEGIKRRRSSFCFPGEISHGAYYNLLSKNTDYIFLPKVVELHVDNAPTTRREHQCTCQLLQSEAYYLKGAFKGVSSKSKIISPVLDFSQGWDTQLDQFIKIASDCGIRRQTARAAYFKAIESYNDFRSGLLSKGKTILDSLSSDPKKIGVVLFGRPYNAFASEANMGIPEKLASCGVTVIPYDFLPLANEKCDFDINWAIGINLMRASIFTARHPQLFGVYITNFSCGPDSFLLGYFRDYMKNKPSLTLELDSHTADAGIITRIEAFLDIVERYRALNKKDEATRIFKLAKIEVEDKIPVYISSEGKRLSLNDPSVHILFPSMGRLTSELITSVFSGSGYRASALPVYDRSALKTGRANTTCKECLPLILTTGGLLKHLSLAEKNENLVFFMPTCGGNCRFTQYNVFLNKLIEKNAISNVALLSWTNENGYAGLPLTDALNILKSVIISDCMEDIKNALRVLAVDSKKALESFEFQWKRIVTYFEGRMAKGLYPLLESVAYELSKIPLKFPLTKAKKISLMGEIFVRRDYFSCNDVIERLADKEIVVKRQPVLEWLAYCDYNVINGVYQAQFNLKEYIEFKARTLVRDIFEKKIKKIMAASNLYEYETVDIEKTIEYGKKFFDVRFTGEAILVTGSFFREIIHSISGAISIGPFACMPTRVTEAVLSPEATMETKVYLDKNAEPDPDICSLPFLSIETDGNPFPQILEARIEAFCLQVERLHETITKKDSKRDKFRRKDEGKRSDVEVVLVEK
jgi:predicted CoA-substrate-specific enzyme activase